MNGDDQSVNVQVMNNEFFVMKVRVEAVAPSHHSDAVKPSDNARLGHITAV